MVYFHKGYSEEDNTKIQNAILKEVSKGECIIMARAMRDFNHGHIQWKSLV